MVTCLADLTQMVSEADSHILESSKHFSDVMQVFRETAINLHEKGLNQQLIIFMSHLIMNRKTQNIVKVYMQLIVTSLFCSFIKEQSMIDKVGNCLVVLMNNAEAQGLQSELAVAIDMALQAQVFQKISEKTKKTIAEILYALKE